MSASTAHPRSRGENERALNLIFAPFGSSPLTRGKLTLLHRQATDEGLIPAHAGKTTRVILSHYACPAHPRSRGENAALRRRGRFSRGSSPLTRGKPELEVFVQVFWRLIPAHAGKTLKLAQIAF